MKRDSGQAVLVVLLVMAVVLTIVLSILGASTSDIKISSNETESLRAFSAAESGIEKALLSNSSVQGSIGNANYNVTVSSLAQGAKTFNYPASLPSGDLAILWFVAHDANGNLTCGAGTCFTGKSVKVCWGKPGTLTGVATTPAVDITVYYTVNPGDYSTTRMVKSIYDPNPARLSGDFYSSADLGTCTVDNTDYQFQKTIDLSTLGISAGSYNSQNGLQFLTVRTLYNTDQDQSLGFDLNFAGNSTIPAQGNKVDSTGTLNTSTRRIFVTSPYGGYPPILDTAIFSPGGITK